MNIIKKIRTDKNISQAEFSRLLGVSVTSVSQWENDNRKPTKSIMLLITLSVKELETAHKKLIKIGI